MRIYSMKKVQIESPLKSQSNDAYRMHVYFNN